MNKSFAAAFVLTVSLTVLWGFGHRLYDTLLPQFAAVFALKDVRLSLTQSVYNFVYFFGAIPAALYARLFGYKAAILLGLGFLCVGAFTLYPASETLYFPYYLAAVIFMGAGWLVLEIAANPLFAAFGRENTAVQRLNFAQCFYPVGALAGVYAGRWILSANLTLPVERFAYSIAHPYIIIGAAVLLLAFLIEEAPYPEAAKERIPSTKGVMDEFVALLSRPLFVFAIAAQFSSVMGLGAVWSKLNAVFVAAFADTTRPHFTDLTDLYVWALLLFGTGRIISTAMMSWISPARVLLYFTCGGLVLSLIAILSGGPIGAVAVLGISFSLSLTWPTILGMTIQGLGQRAKLATALLAMGGALGGIAYHLLALIWKGPAVHFTMIIPAVCCLVMMGFALASEKTVRRSQTQ